ncbi:hypothetical protein [Oenococcus sicerae]|uniref:hypothetical protein n=1 Tax=Oenococcus sicerae TaxID=2203724 RepID=UPI0039E7F044
MNDQREIDGTLYINGLSEKNYKALYCSKSAYLDRIYDLNTALTTFFDPERTFTRSIVSQIRLLKKLDAVNETKSDQRMKILINKTKLNRSDHQARQIMVAVFDLMTHLLSRSPDELGDYREIVPDFDSLIAIEFPKEPIKRAALAQRAYGAFLDGRISKQDFIEFMNRKEMKGADYHGGKQ